MKIFEQLDLAKQLRQTGTELECTTLKEGGVAIRDFLVKELAAEMQELFQLARHRDERSYHGFPIITRWQPVDIAELTNLKEALNSTNRRNRPLKLPKLDGLRIDLKVPYDGHQLLWRVCFESLDDLGQALLLHNLNLDWEGARQQLRSEFSHAKEELNNFELLWGKVSKGLTVSHDLVDWKQAANGLYKFPERVNFGLEWASSRDRWKNGRRGLIGGEWIYVSPTGELGWDVSDARTGNRVSPHVPQHIGPVGWEGALGFGWESTLEFGWEGVSDADEKKTGSLEEDERLVCREQAIQNMDAMGCVALYLYQGGGAGLLVQANKVGADYRHADPDAG